jgi:hypothetical protein
MQIVFDYDFNSAGDVVSTHYIETSDSSVQAMLTGVKVSAAAQTTAGYSVMSKHPAYPGKTRWQVVLAEAARLNDPIARGILGV